MKKRMLLIVTLLLLGSYTFAQDPGDFGDGDDPDPIDAPAVSIDNYIELQMLSAVAFALYRIRFKKNKMAVVNLPHIV